MADTESIQQIAHSRAPLSTWLGVVLLFALFGIIVLAIIGPMPRGSDYEEARAKKRMEKLKTVREEAEKDLTTYAWIDKNKGVARIPISRAMELTVADLAQKKPAPAGPIATPAAPAGSAAPAPPAAAGSPKAGAAQPAGSPSVPAPAASASPAAQTAASPPPVAQPASSALASPSPATTP